MITVRFWGVRGSIPCPGPHTMRYGGNTSCYEIRFHDAGRRIIIDAGSGIRDLGNSLADNGDGNKTITAEIYLTHTHWDHIMGFPFFLPAYIPGARIKISGPVFRDDETLEDIVVGGQMKYKYFPVKMADLSASIDYQRLGEVSRLDLGDGIVMSTTTLNHPIVSLSYRFEYQGRSVVTAYDTEPFRNGYGRNPSEPPLNEEEARAKNQGLQDFYRGADLLIHDAQYTSEEYERYKIGWGHSPMEYAVDMAARAGVKRLALTHHDPKRTDAQLDALAGTYCEPGRHGGMEVFFASEATEVILD